MDKEQLKQLKENIKIVDFLASKGIQPDEIKKNGTDYWYKSPIREEKEASFHVNHIKNIWNDFGGSGGTILDLFMVMYNLNFSDALKMAENYSDSPEIKKASSNNNYKIIETETTGYECFFSEVSDAKLIKYAKDRNISIELINTFCCQANYKRNSKQDYYFRNIAFKNDLNGYELRGSPYYDKGQKKMKDYQGCMAPKYITTFEGTNRDHVILFEGYFDFLSYLTYFKKTTLETDIIVLNSTNCAKDALVKLAERKYEIIHLYFDNDKAGWGATKKVIEVYPYAENLSVLLFPGIQDFNLFLMNERYHEYRNRWG